MLPLGIRKSLNANCVQTHSGWGIHFRCRPKRGHSVTKKENLRSANCSPQVWVGYTLSMPPQTRAQCYKKRKPAERELLTAGVEGVDTLDDICHRKSYLLGFFQ